MFIYICVHIHVCGHSPYKIGLVNIRSIGLPQGSCGKSRALCIGQFNSRIHMQSLIFDIQMLPVVVYLTTRWKNCFTYDANSACMKYTQLCRQVLLLLFNRYVTGCRGCSMHETIQVISGICGLSGR